ncbi:MAG: alcohol dehydrogenase catalytic domain-containing protein [SAR324 cluster bacterium]|jgi:NAD+-dependent secondary alcohol dehydrogenase Adh1|nr:alcohol dehydrogenase catalytic domain-containing protein [SAR324 cluster bacterium]MEC8259532.1 alcohol dehydrogenase catalytic domain-containing protein [SAR324 cluster bacterium]MEC8359247.1 alcohol dehydrogenase catalytic domain-containing protein [SAR324 cluster bacterium]MEC8594104.1 alcohol dehydrogenase catalytic domain-containing protein [SAR324 cluster bacterium]|tara:strand:+ start:6910 stop:7950 length:1041 start_codon:yes stop_codon:yes gene_type:complete
MKAAVLHRYDPELRNKELVIYQETPDPDPPTGEEVLVHIRAAGVCRTDLHMITGRDLGIPLASLPHILGHENAGIVKAIGDEVQGFEVGDKVLCYPFQSNGGSLAERYGIDSQANQRITPGINSSGGFCEFLKFPQRSLIKVGKDANLNELAPLGDAGLTAYGAVRKLMGHIRPQDNIVVIGIGGVGHLGAQLLSRLTPGKIFAVDPRKSARDLANKAGVKNCFESLEELEFLIEDADSGVRAIIDFFGEDRIPNQALRLLANQGRYVAVGTGGEVRLSTAELVAREISIVGSFVGTFTDLVEITNLTERGELVSEVTTYSLSDANRALQDLAQGKVTGRAVLIPE